MLWKWKRHSSIKETLWAQEVAGGPRRRRMTVTIATSTLTVSSTLCFNALYTVSCIRSCLLGVKLLMWCGWMLQTDSDGLWWQGSCWTPREDLGQASSKNIQGETLSLLFCSFIYLFIYVFYVSSTGSGCYNFIQSLWCLIILKEMGLIWTWHHKEIH